MNRILISVPAGPRLTYRAGGVLLTVAFAVFLAGCRAPQEQPESEEKTAVSQESGAVEEGSGSITFDAKSEKLAGIRLTPAKLTSLRTTIAVNGQIGPNPNGIVRIASIVPGRITSLPVSQGTRVAQGQTLAIIESRSIGEAQSAYQQAAARLQTAKSNLDVVLRQANAGVFANAPLETARRAVVDAQADVSAQTTALRQNQIALDNAVKLARAGSFARPALEAARGQYAAAQESLKSAQAASDNADAAVASAQSELARRRQTAAAGGYSSRPVEEARRALVSAQSAKNAAQSEVTTVRANLARLTTLLSEGLVAKRDVEAAQSSLDAAQSRLESSTADVSAAQAELDRQQKLAATDVTGTAEVQAAQGQLASAQADVRTRRAEVVRAQEGVRLAKTALDREKIVVTGDIANRREISTARANLQNARTALTKAQQTLVVVNAAYKREQRIYRQNLNNIAQVQAARSNYIGAQSDFRAAHTALQLLKSSPGGSASIAVRSPIAGVVQERDVAQGETVEADKALFTVVNLDRVSLEAALYEKDVASVRVGASVRVTVDALAGQIFNGTISYIGTKLDPETRTLTARALILNTGELRPGMFARGQLGTGSGTLSVAVPKDAVQSMDEKSVVFVPGSKPDTFEQREVVTGSTADGWTAIRSGLKPGEKVVSSGAFVVKSQAMKGELAED